MGSCCWEGDSQPEETGRDDEGGLSSPRKVRRVSQHARDDAADDECRVYLADANLLAIRRLLSRSKATAYTTTTPGPPLSSAHPSPSLLAKLNINVHALYDESHSLIHKPSSLKNLNGTTFIPSIANYIALGRSVSLALSYKWLGIDAGENGGREKCGESICWLGLAEAELKEIESGGKVMGIAKGKGKEKGGKVHEELESVRSFRSGYEKVNDTVRNLRPLVVSSFSQSRPPHSLADEFETGPFPTHPCCVNAHVANSRRTSCSPSQAVRRTSASIHGQDERRSDAVLAKRQSRCTGSERIV